LSGPTQLDPCKLPQTLPVKQGFNFSHLLSLSRALSSAKTCLEPSKNPLPFSQHKLHELPKIADQDLVRLSDYDNSDDDESGSDFRPTAHLRPRHKKLLRKQSRSTENPLNHSDSDSFGTDVITVTRDQIQESAIREEIPAGARV